MYEQGTNETLKVIVQIKSRAGLNNVEKIARVESLDVLLISKCFNTLKDCVNRNFIEATILYVSSVVADRLTLGPFDLSKQLQVARGGDEHEAAIQRILKVAHAAGKKAAIFYKVSLLLPILLTAVLFVVISTTSPSVSDSDVFLQVLVVKMPRTVHSKDSTWSQWCR
jgi:2-keto-3-deoxy-L-rhamnonate aldolase RhmA